MEFPDLNRFPYFGYDTETTGLRYRRDRVFGFSISTPDEKNYYWDIRTQPKAVNWFNDQMTTYKGRIICHNASFDYRMSHYSGLYMPIECMDCTGIRAALLNEWEEKGYSLDALAEKYLGQHKETEIYELAARAFGGNATRKAQIGNIYRLPANEVDPYAKQDTRLTINLWLWQNEEIKRQAAQEINIKGSNYKSIEDVILFEREVMEAIISVEMAGVRVDVPAAERVHGELDIRAKELLKRIRKEIGYEININSGPQVKKFFEPKEISPGIWVANDGTKLGVTDKGNPSIDANVLREMKHPVAKMILEARSVIKTRDTFIGKYILESNIAGRVYPNINQMVGEDGGTYSGRLSYTGVALQQIPSRDKKQAEIVKGLFVPEEGHLWGDNDMASFEVRVATHLMNDKSIIRAYQKDPYADFHQIVADILSINRTARYNGDINAKQTNLSLIFGSGWGSIAEKMGLPWEWDSFEDPDKPGRIITYKKAGAEMAQFRKKYDRAVPGVQGFLEKATKKARARGFVFTRSGRRLRFGKGQNYPHKAGGMLIQATSGDINKECWLIAHRLLPQYGCRLIVNVHDQFGISFPEDCDWKNVMSEFQHEITEATKDMKAPILLDVKTPGKNWWDGYNGELVRLK